MARFLFSKKKSIFVDWENEGEARLNRLLFEKVRLRVYSAVNAILVSKRLFLKTKVQLDVSRAYRSIIAFRKGFFAENGFARKSFFKKNRRFSIDFRL